MLHGTTVKEVREFLDQFPDEAFVYAYEGEVTAIVVVSATGKAQLGELGATYPRETKTNKTEE